jgi:TetR/AcrR family acrAB operon transcriptional repressor
MRRTKEEAEKTRQDILNAALGVFSRKGYEAARLETVAKQAGVTRGAIYHHFDGKEALYLALFDDATAIGNQAIQRAMQEGTSFLDTVEKILVYTLNLLEEDVRFRQVKRLSLQTVDMRAVRERSHREAETLVESVGEAFRGGIASGELRPDLDPLTAARAFLAYQNGLAHLWLANPDAFSITDNAPDLAAVFLHGVAAN